MLEKSAEIEKLIEEYTNYENISSKEENSRHCVEQFETEGDVEREIHQKEEITNENITENESVIYDQDKKEIDSKINNPNKPKKSHHIKKELRKKYEENIKKFFLKQSNTNNQENICENNDTSKVIGNSSNTDDILAFTRLKKLKRRADIIKEKEITKKVSFKQFFETEAELGSDNEDHDDVIKNIKNEEAEEEENQDEELKDLINNEEEFSSDEIQEKFFSDMLERDREELRKVIDGPQRKTLNRKHLRNEGDCLEEDSLPLNMRIKQSKSQENTGEGDFNLLLKKFGDFEKRLNSTEENHENEEYKEMVNLYQQNLIKKFAEKSKNHKTSLMKRIRENEKILENVINLNNIDVNSSKDKNNKLFVQGMMSQNKPITDSNNVGTSSHSSHLPHRMKLGTMLNSKNSFLHAMKNDKYYKKLNSSDEVSLIPQNSTESSSNTSTSTNTSMNSKSNTMPLFMKNSNSNLISNNKSTNLSCLFTRSSKPRHNVDHQVKKIRTPNKNDGNVFNLKKLLN